MKTDPANYTIRPAKPDDVEDLMRLIRAIAESANLSHHVEATDGRIRASLFGERPLARAFVATYGDVGTVGYAVFFYSFSTFLAKACIYLEDLYVAPEYRGNGIGKSLFKAVAQVAFDEDCGRMEWSALDWNKPALDFYKAQGAERLDSWRLHRFQRSQLAELLS